MLNSQISPDGRAVAFGSYSEGVVQVFVMLTSGGDPLQLTTDEGDKQVSSFSPDGREIYYQRLSGQDESWAVPTLGGNPRRVLAGTCDAAIARRRNVLLSEIRQQIHLPHRQIGTGGGNTVRLRNGRPLRRGILPFPDGGKLLIISNNVPDSDNFYFSRWI